MKKKRTPKSRKQLRIINAVPGAGKTTAILDKVMHEVITKQINEPDILILTFSRKMANELRAKLAEAGVSNVQAQTCHAFAFGLIRQAPQKYRFSDAPKVLNDPATARFIKQETQSYFLKKPPISINKLIKCFKDHDQKGIPLPQILGKHKIKDSSSSIKRFMRHLQKKMAQDNLITFQQMIKLVYKSLATDKAYRHQTIGRYQCIFIDEYQDMNPQDQKLARLLLKTIKKGMVVGDDMQNIYGFRGVKPGAMKQLSKTLSNAKVINRNKSYRLTQETARFVNSVLKQNGFDLTIEGHLHGKKPRLYTATDRAGMYSQVTTAIKRLLDNGVAPQKIAVLAPFNFSLLWLTRHLTRARIPLVMVKSCKKQGQLLKLFVLFLRSVAGNKQQAACAQLLIHTSKINEEQARQLSEHIESDVEKKKLGLSDQQHRKIRDTRKAIRHARTYKSVHRILSTFNKSLVGRKGRYQQYAIENILKSKGIRVDDKTTPKQLYQKIARLKSSSVPGITLSTIHSAKGSQWEYVLILDLYDEILSKNREFKNIDYEEKFREYYVAITRSSREIHLFQLMNERLLASHNTHNQDSQNYRNEKTKYKYKRYRFLPHKKEMMSLCVKRR